MNAVDLGELRARDFGYLDAEGHTCLDCTGAGLAPTSLVRAGAERISPYVSPKKNAPNAIQNMIIAVDPGSGAAGSNAPARNSTANIATIITGEPTNTATDSRL